MSRFRTKTAPLPSSTISNLRQAAPSRESASDPCIDARRDAAHLTAFWPDAAQPCGHTEQTFGELRACIDKTVAFVESVPQEQYTQSAEREVRLSRAPGKYMKGEVYLSQMAIPNIYFHLSMAYAILRHNGVDVGKMDFLGPLNLIDG